MKILIVEDEKALLQSIANYLEKDGNVCETASTYEDALYKIDLYEYDLLVLDINLITGSGLDILKLLKEKITQAFLLLVKFSKNKVMTVISFMGVTVILTI